MWILIDLFIFGCEIVVDMLLLVATFLVIEMIFKQLPGSTNTFFITSVFVYLGLSFVLAILISPLHVHNWNRAVSQNYKKRTFILTSFFISFVVMLITFLTFRPF